MNQPLRPEDVASITPGETKWNDVIKRLGAPNELSKTHTGSVATYYYYDGKNFDVNFGYPLNFLPPISYAPHKLDLGGSGVGWDTFQVAFDANGTVQYDGFSHAAPAAKFRAWPFGSQTP